MQAFPPGMGGDLEGGKDEARNGDIHALKRMFLSSSSSEEDGQQTEASGPARFGRYPDLPLARWSNVFLPSQQVLLNVFQPQYVLMFEKIIAGPKPWRYLHVHLPGGIESLGDPDYALPVVNDTANATTTTTTTTTTSKAPLCGTLMEVAHVERLRDARLAIVVQGLGRAVVVKGTQALPYARADVQVLPDSECLLSSAVCARARMMPLGGLPSLSPDARAWRALGAAMEEDACWRAYENAPVRVDVDENGRTRPPPAFCCFDPSASESASRCARAVIEPEEEPQKRAETSYSSVVDGYAYDDSALVGSMLDDTFATVSSFDDEDEAVVEDTRALLALEHQVWLELDNFLRRIAENGRMPVPKQLLCLLPPPPAAGWPPSFVLKTVVGEIKKSAMQQRSMATAADEYDPEPYAPLDPRYPTRRRAERLSFSLWLVIREEGLDLQPLLEATSTSDRLRMGLLRMRELVERLPPSRSS
jgi:hypothetical protein